MKELNSPDDFKWYKHKLDLDQKYEHVHDGEPTKYPCRVSSTFHSYDGGCARNPPPDEYRHEFIYQIESTCPSCGHKTIGWPGVNEAPVSPTQESTRAQ